MERRSRSLRRVRRRHVILIGFGISTVNRLTKERLASCTRNTNSQIFSTRFHQGSTPFEFSSTCRNATLCSSPTMYRSLCFESFPRVLERESAERVLFQYVSHHPIHGLCH